MELRQYWNVIWRRKWLVLATVQDGRPQTNLCQGTTTLAGLDPQAQRAVDAALAATEPDSSEAPPPATPEAAEPSAVQPSIVPAAAGRVLAVALGIILLFAIALVIRRRSAVS